LAQQKMGPALTQIPKRFKIWVKVILHLLLQWSIILRHLILKKLNLTRTMMMLLTLQDNWVKL
jgi:hypothetical protein